MFLELEVAGKSNSSKDCTLDIDILRITEAEHLQQLARLWSMIRRMNPLNKERDSIRWNLTANGEY